MTPHELKNSILQMAIQGKLVEQRSEEGSAEELYQLLQAEFWQENCIKKKNNNTIAKDEQNDILFEIPNSWKWVRLGTIGYTNIGLTYNPKDIATDGTIVLRSSNIQNGKVDYADTVRVKMTIPENKLCHKGDILICVRNGSKRLVGKSAIVDKDGMSFGAFMAIFRSPCNEYILHVINSVYFRNSLLGDTGTTTINQITQDMIRKVFIPLPPLAEQKRIVAKIEELLPYIDRYEQAWTRLEDLNMRFQDDMKKSILQRAIQGKLVEQRPQEGTAEELYQQIRAEKQRLIKARKIKKEKPLSEITEDEKPFDIPESWKWVRLGELTHFQGGYAFKSSTYVPSSNNQVIRLGNVKPNNLVLNEKQVFIPDDIALVTIEYKLKENDILVTMTGTRKKRDYFFTLAVSAEDLTTHNLFLNQRVGCLRIYGLIDVKYLLCVLQNENIKDLIFAKETGTANQGNIGSEDMKYSILVPLPPLAEQKRIVAKLEELLPLCDMLKRG